MAKTTDSSMATISSSTLLESSDGIQASESPVRPTSTSADGNQASEFILKKAKVIFVLRVIKYTLNLVTQTDAKYALLD